ncbi:hypothetical protein MTO96_013743 [Rhipicephalus appendiculatus]
MRKRVKLKSSEGTTRFAAPRDKQARQIRTCDDARFLAAVSPDFAQRAPLRASGRHWNAGTPVQTRSQAWASVCGSRTEITAATTSESRLPAAAVAVVSNALARSNYGRRCVGSVAGPSRVTSTLSADERHRTIL